MAATGWQRPIRAAAALLLVLPFLPTPSGVASARYDWLQFDGNAQHSGDNTQETALTVETVGRLHRLFRVPLPSFADGAPVYLHAVATPHGVRDLLLDGYVHKYAAGTGAEITGRGWPELVTREPALEKQAAALGVATAPDGATYLYVATSSYGDAGDYQGHLTTINLASGAQHVFNALCGDHVDVHFAAAAARPDCGQTGAGIWSRAAAVYDPDTGRIYATTGNGAFAPAAHDWGETVLALHPDGTGAQGAPLDSYTPANYQALTARDADLGSTAPAILPPLAHSRIRHLAVQGGKDGTLRLLNLDNLSGQGGPGHFGGEVGAVIPVPQGEGVLPQPAVWVNPRDGSVWVFVATRHGLAGLTVTVARGGIPDLGPMWSTRATHSTSPLVAGGVLYCAGSGHIQARDPDSGAVVWQDRGVGRVHWSSPVVANGILYIADESPGLTAYGLKP